MRNVFGKKGYDDQKEAILNHIWPLSTFCSKIPLAGSLGTNAGLVALSCLTECQSWLMSDGFMLETNLLRTSDGPTTRITNHSGIRDHQESNFVDADNIHGETEVQNGDEKVTVRKSRPRIPSGITSMPTDVSIGLLESISNVLRWTFSIIHYPFQYILVAYLSIYLTGWAISCLDYRFREVVCNQRQLAFVFGEYCIPNEGPEPQVIGFSKTAEAQGQLGIVATYAGEGAGLALCMKSNEHALRDLTARARTSNLDNKEIMSHQLELLLSKTKPLPRKLSQLSAKVSSVLDVIIASDYYAIKRLGSIQASRNSILLTTLAVIDPLCVFHNGTMLAADEADLKKTFIAVTSSTVKSLPHLITHTESLAQDLGQVENTLLSINDLVKEENCTGKGQVPSELQSFPLVRLWNKVRGEEGRVMEAFRNHSTLLGDITQYYEHALSVVKLVLVTLYQIQYDMEGFRDLHAHQAFWIDDTPLEVHMNRLRMAVTRLNEERWTLDASGTRQIEFAG
jgi:hypothetical protein